MIKIAICDDEERIRNKIYKICISYLDKSNYLFSIDIFNDGEELLIKNNIYNVVLLDINMNKSNGIEVAKKLMKKCKSTKIIFITNLKDYIKQALRVHAFGFIEKPIKREELCELIEEALKYNHSNYNTNKKILFNTINGDVILDIEKIMYFEYLNRKIKIITIDKSYYIYGKIFDIEKKLGQYGFMSPHKSFIVNFKHILNIYGYDIMMNDNNIIPLSQKKSSEFRKRMCEFISLNFITYRNA